MTGSAWPHRIDRLVVASHNPDKIAEIEAILGDLTPPIEVMTGLDWPEIAETEPTLEGNALLKARTVARLTGIAALGDDTGLEVAALDGAPGVTTARFAGPDASYTDNVARLLAVMDGVAARAARFRTVVAVAVPTGEAITVEGVLEGWITERPRGEGGFGYDPVFAVGDRTLAELDIAVKNRISHRALAVRAVREALAG
ncbi:MAG: RdgB/HAM1 family non-canonical purine NTP pyrophosphatase [Actinomycetota bacterium]|nr:RdgB/HAM1 family non-canonical purine NTP pyrophosphatase [Actinomycetota bacterium]